MHLPPGGVKRFSEHAQTARGQPPLGTVGTGRLADLSQKTSPHPLSPLCVTVGKPLHLLETVSYSPGPSSPCQGVKEIISEADFDSHKSMTFPSSVSQLK